MTKTLHTPTATLTRMTIDAPGRVGYYEESIPELRNGQFQIETLFSGISAGTDLSQFGGTNFKVTEAWDAVHRVFRHSDTGEVSETYPLAFFGYMQAGKVVATKTDKVKVGQVISMDYGHRTAAIVNDTDRYVVIPESMDPLLGIYPGKLGPVCANGVLFAADETLRRPVDGLEGTLQDQRVVVFGAGVVGMLTALMAKWAGASSVAIVDRIPERLRVAEKFGLIPFDTSHTDVPVAIKDLWPAPGQSGGAANANSAEAIRNRYADKGIDRRGADIAFQCTGSDYVLNLSFEALRVGGTVIDMGFYQGGAPKLQLGSAFHHNRLRHICAQIGGTPEHQPGWDRPRLSQETIKFLGEYGTSIKDRLITHQLPFDQAQEAYERLQANDPQMLQVVLIPSTKTSTNLLV